MHYVPAARAAGLLIGVVRWSADGSKPGAVGYHDVVDAIDAMDDQEVSGLVPAGHDTDMAIFRVKYEVAGDCLVP